MLSLSVLQLLGKLLSIVSQFSARKVWQNIGKFKQTVHFICNRFITGIKNIVSLMASFYGPCTWWTSSWQTHSSPVLTTRPNLPHRPSIQHGALLLASNLVFSQPEAVITNSQTSFYNFQQSIHRYREYKKIHILQKLLIF